jgi:hypothetical protein
MLKEKGEHKDKIKKKCKEMRQPLVSLVHDIYIKDFLKD